MSEQSRIAALKAALEFRSAASNPDDTIELARRFDAYLTEGGDGREPSADGRKTGTLRLAKP